MTKRYRERLDVIDEVDDRGRVAPRSFQWRGQRYRVVSVLGHWHEDEGWWQRADGAPRRIERTDLWRVEARNGTPERGIYELVRQGGQWRLDRVWD